MKIILYTVKKRKTLKRILLILLLVFVVMQFFQIDKSHPKIVKRKDFISMTNPPKDVELMIRNACYDCHSYETEYPWYSNVAPVSWWTKDHIDEGREHLNFSEWGSKSKKFRDHKLDECAEEIEEGKMPMNSYTWAHGDAKLSSAQRETLAKWFESQMSGASSGY